MFVTASPSVPKRLEPVVKRGFEYWNSVLGKTAFLATPGLELEPGETGTSWIILVGVESEYRKTSCAFTSLQWHTYNSCIFETWVKINPKCLDRKEAWLESLIRHEAGHALGLRHSDELFELMYPTLQDSLQHPVDASEGEIRAVRKLYGVK
jgi:predicted Zn-dependent protease